MGYYELAGVILNVGRWSWLSCPRNEIMNTKIYLLIRAVAV